MTAGQYLVGALFFAGVIGGAALAAYLVWRRHFRSLRGVVGVLAWTVLFFAALILTQLIPGASGVLTRGCSLLTAIGLAALAYYFARRGDRDQPGGDAGSRQRPPRGARAARLELALPVLLAAAVAAWGLVLLWQRRTTLASAPFSFDMLTFDFPLIARWMQSRSLWVAHDLVALTSHAAYPQNGDLVDLAVILPWRNAFLAPLVSYPVWALTAMAVYAIAVELDARPWAAMVVASVFAATPLVLLSVVVDNLPDVFMWAMFACGVLFLVRHVRTGKTSELVLAGLSLGLSFGSKWYGLTCVPVAIVMWLAASLAAGRGRRLWHETAVVVGLTLAAGGFWLVRNVLEYGDPVFPHQVRAFGVMLFSSPVDTYGQAFGFTVAHYIGEWGAWRHFLIPEYEAVLRLGGFLLIAGLLITTGVAARRLLRVRSSLRPTHVRRGAVAAGGPDPGPPLARRFPALYLGLAGSLILVVYLVTPQTAVGPRGMPVLAGINARYAVPGLLLSAIIIAWGLSLLKPRLWLVPQLIAAVALADAYRGDGADLLAFDAGPLTVSGARLAITAIILVAAGYAAIRVCPQRPVSAGPHRLGTVALLTAAILLAAAGGGYALQRRFNADSLRGRDPVIDWVLTHAPSHTRIGLTGSWSTDAPPVLAMFGPRFGNTVRYVGRVDRGLVRHFSSYRAWIRAVQADRLGLLLVGRQPQPQESDIEARWAARARFPVLAISPRFALYRPVAPS